MSVLFVAVPLALVIVAGAVIAFAWAVRSGQMDDLETPALRVLLDDEPDAPSPGGRPPDPSP